MDKKNVEAIYPLSGMQQALLFHRLATGTADPGLLQVRCTLNGGLNVAAFERSWHTVVRRHPALRTSIHWEELDQPLQVVMRQGELPWTHQDWRDASALEQQRMLENFLHEDRERELDFSHAPIGRLALFRVEENRWHLVWSCHHILLDGWSGALVLQEVLALHDHILLGVDACLPAPPSYRDYVGWLKRQNASEAEAFWRQTLAGIAAPTPLPFDRTPEGETTQQYRFGQQDTVLSSAASATLHSFVKQNRLTLSTLVQGIWALILSRHSGPRDVVFGATVSGRSADLPGIESMVGLFTNAIPVRVDVEPDTSVLSLLKQIHDSRHFLQKYEHTPLAQIHALSDFPSHQRLFESLLVFENYPQALAATVHGRGLELDDLRGGITSSYPITVVAVPGSALSLTVIYDTARFNASDMTRLLQQIQSLLACVVAEPGRPISDLFSDTGAPEERSIPVPMETRVNGPARRSTSGAKFVAPRDHVELLLTQIWESTFSRHPIGLRDSFFDLGGHSLLAAQLIAEVEQAFHRRLPLSVLFQAPTVADMARLFAEETPKVSWGTLAPMRTQGSAPPLFCIHGLAGHVFKYARLMRHLSPDQPVYAVQSLGFDGTEIPFRTMDAMARRYITDIRAVRPQGPYLLASNCAGGMIALEMTRQLEEQGERVALLAIFDPPTTAVGPLLRDGMKRLRHRRFQQYVMARVVLSTGRILPHRLRQAYVATTIKTLIARYRPAPISGRITLFTTRQIESSMIHMEWSGIASGGVEVCQVNGPHDLLQEPYVGTLASALQGCIHRALGEVPERTGTEAML